MPTRPDRIEPLLRELAQQVLARLARRHRDFAGCEDAVQEALLAAADCWRREGIPVHPRAWLVRVAERRLIDAAQSEVARRAREQVVASQREPVRAAELPDPDEIDPDDILALFFTCCHPALTPASAIALTLRAVGGLTTTEIARAFLVPEATIGQRISRAKETIRTSAIPFALPAPAERPARLAALLHVLYLVFNEGYTSSSGATLQRTELAGEAIRLAREVHRLLPESGDAAGLLALMLLTDARRAARVGPRGELIPLDQQDRRLWDRNAIAEGTALAELALAKGAVGEYQLQAAIAALHDEAARVEDTDWVQIASLYELLLRRSDNPVVALNHAIAVAMVEGPAAGLALLAPLDQEPRLASGHRLPAVRAHLLERAGQREAAISLYREAAARTTSLPEQQYLLLRAARLADPES